MKKFLSLTLILAYVMLIPIFFTGCSCEKEPGLVIGTHDTYISYTNLKYGNHERQNMNLHVPKKRLVK